MRKWLWIILLCLPAYGYSWGMLGHRIVGEIASKHISSKARHNIQKILGNESIAMCANWPDFIKSDTTFKYLTPWHYKNYSGGLSHAAFLSDTQTDTTVSAYTQLNFLIVELKKKELPKELKVRYLKLLIHIVGDIHQPLHLGRYEDLGGNRIRVMWFKDNVNLHQVWDDRIIDYQQLSYTEYAQWINFSTAKERKLWQRQPISEWMYESYVIAEKIYGEIQPDAKLGYRYNFDYIETVNSRLLKGGLRLAELLNDIFG
ncbi:MAG: S1/P1 nuclease [Ferruginibacter sp.]|nr:S1/P1 nuclease [Ferruginibacter sp.]